jgi:hypothetical protein
MAGSRLRQAARLREAVPGLYLGPDAMSAVERLDEAVANGHA